MRHLYGIDATAWCLFESYLDNKFESTIHFPLPVSWGVAYHRDLYWVQDYIPCSSTQIQISSDDMAYTVTATLMTFKYICSVKIQMLTYKHFVSIILLCYNLFRVYSMCFVNINVSLYAILRVHRFLCMCLMIISLLINLWYTIIHY